MNYAEQCRARASAWEAAQKQSEASHLAHQQAIQAELAKLAGVVPAHPIAQPVQAPAPIPGGIQVLQGIAKYITPMDQEYLSMHLLRVPEIFATQEGRDLLAMFLGELKKIVDSTSPTAQ